MRVSWNIGICGTCGSHRDDLGTMVHNSDCLYPDAVDVDYVDSETNERTKIFCPYTPENFISNMK